MSEQPGHYFRALGFDLTLEALQPSERLREAYDRAHDIRKFEIQMYWTRSAYLWTIQAAALAGLALVASEFEATSWQCAGLNEAERENCFANQFRLMLVIAIWTFGAFTAYTWLLLLKGAKHWQNNWERHVDILEDKVSGALYKTYPVDMSKMPYSVSKLNELMAHFMVFLWISLGVISAALYLRGSNIVALIPFFVLGIYLTACHFDSRLRMSDERLKPVEGTTGLFNRSAPTFEPETKKMGSRIS